MSWKPVLLNFCLIGIAIVTIGSIGLMGIAVSQESYDRIVNAGGCVVAVLIVIVGLLVLSIINKRKK